MKYSIIEQTDVMHKLSVKPFFTFFIVSIAFSNKQLVCLFDITAFLFFKTIGLTGFTVAGFSKKF